MDQRSVAKPEVRIQVLPALSQDRQVRADRPSLPERLEERTDDIREAIEVGTRSIARSISELAAPDGWSIGEVSVSFGIALTAEAGALITKTSVGATLEVALTFVQDRPLHAPRSAP